ncbi:MAG: flagellar hook-basal body complex protein [Pseudomonadota bacterium]
MDNAAYVALTRQTGLLKAMQAAAHNIANISTTGYRGEGVIFTEVLVNHDGPPGTIAMSSARVRLSDMRNAALTPTGGTLDLGLDGPGFFTIDTPQGLRLTRTGAFTRSLAGEMVTLEGHPVLDDGGAPIFLPPDAATISISSDGTIDAGGQILGRVGVVELTDLSQLTRQSGLLFDAGDAPLEPAVTTRVVQGSLEGSNVDGVLEMARMIEIHRAYELNATFLDREDQRIRAVIRTLGQPA